MYNRRHNYTERRRGTEKIIEEIMPKVFSNLMKTTNVKFLELNSPKTG